MKRDCRKAVIGVALLLILVISAGCGGTPSSGGTNPSSDGAAPSTPGETSESTEPIPIGAVNPLTGGGSAWGPGMAKGIELAADEINAAGGPLGRPLRVYYEDGGSNPDDAVRAAQKLIEVNGVAAIVGTWSSAVTLAVTPLTIEAGIIEMSVSGAPEISELDDNGTVFRTFPPNTRFGWALAQLAQERGYKRAATMSLNNPAQIAIGEQFKKYFEEAGGEVVASVVYNPDQSSYQSEVAEVLRTSPELIVLACYAPDATVLLKDLFQAGNEAAIFGTAFGINSQVIEALGPEPVEGVLAMDVVPATDSPTYKRAQELYKEAMGQDLFENPYAPQTFDQVQLLALAIERAGTTEGSAVGQALIEISGPPGQKVYSFEEGAELLRRGEDIDYEGASSRIDFDEKGDVLADYGVYEIHDGQAELIDVIQLN